jgi:hypothetical protein
MAARLDDLAAIEHALWLELQQATQQRGHGWRTGVLATRDGDGADARTVVLREVDGAARAVLIYTDARSGKVAQALQHPHGVLVLWSPALGWQLRLQLALAVETAGLAVSSRWARVKLTPAAQDYISPLPPGSPLSTPVPERASREHFAVLTARVLSVDWLELHAEGHRRARFDAQGQRWLAP